MIRYQGLLYVAAATIDTIDDKGNDATMAMMMMRLMMFVFMCVCVCVCVCAYAVK